MPELPEVETVVRRIRPQIVGAQIRSIDVRRARSVSPQDPLTLACAVRLRIESVRRRGKHVLLQLTPTRDLAAIRIHFGMTGELYVRPAGTAPPKSAAVTVAISGRRVLVFDDMRGLGRFNVLTSAQVEKLDRKLGIEPLSRAFTLEAFLERARASRLPAKLFLMQQDRIAGIGNMYAAESLWRAKVNPRSPINGLTLPKLKSLHAAIPAVLREALKGALKTYERPGEYDTMDFAVYGRKDKPCPRCGAAIQRIQQGGRSTYFCPRCQR